MKFYLVYAVLNSSVLVVNRANILTNAVDNSDKIYQHYVSDFHRFYIKIHHEYI